MSNSAPESKVTIFIEIGDQMKKIDIPHAIFLDIHGTYEGISSDINYFFNCRALQKENEPAIIEEIKPVGEWVLWDIPDNIILGEE